MENSKDTSKINIGPSTNIIDALKKRTEEDAQSQDQPSKESSSSNLPVQTDPNLSTQFIPVYGGPEEAKLLAKNSLATISKNLSPDLPENALETISSFIEKVARGPGSILPMTCKGVSCPFLNVCPLHASSIALPIGQKCPVEETLVVLWVNKHLNALGITDINSPESSFDMDMLYELATQELIRYRCSAKLSAKPELTEERMTSESFSGTPIFSEVISPVLEIMERSGKNIARIRDALVATRKAQLRAGPIILDNTEKSAELRKKALELQRKRELKEELKDAEFNVVEEEDEDEEDE